MRSSGEEEIDIGDVVTDDGLDDDISMHSVDDDSFGTDGDDEDDTPALIIGNQWGKINDRVAHSARRDDIAISSLLETLKMVTQKIAQLETRVATQSSRGAVLPFSNQKPDDLKEDIYAFQKGERRVRHGKRAPQTNVFRVS